METTNKGLADSKLVTDWKNTCTKILYTLRSYRIDQFCNVFFVISSNSPLLLHNHPVPAFRFISQVLPLYKYVQSFL